MFTLIKPVTNPTILHHPAAVFHLLSDVFTVWEHPYKNSIKLQHWALIELQPWPHWLSVISCCVHKLRIFSLLFFVKIVHLIAAKLNRFWYLYISKSVDFKWVFKADLVTKSNITVKRNVCQYPQLKLTEFFFSEWTEIDYFWSLIVIICLIIIQIPMTLETRQPCL